MRFTRARAIAGASFVVISTLLVAACTPPTSPGGQPSNSFACPTAVQSPATPVTFNIGYGSGPDYVASFFPACTASAKGTIMVIPGGGYTEIAPGLTSSAEVQRLRLEGWALVAIKYRLAPFSGWPAQGNDVRFAINWWRNSGAAALGAPASPLVGLGWSAGGHLAEWATVRTDGAHFDASVSVGGGTYWPDRPTSGSAIALFGLLPDYSTMIDASTVPHLDATDPPLLHVHATNDSYVPVAQAQLLYSRSITHGDPAKHQVVIDPSCGHSITCLTPSRIDPFLDSIAP